MQTDIIWSDLLVQKGVGLDQAMVLKLWPMFHGMRELL